MRAKTPLKRLTSLLLCLVMLAQTVVVASAAGFSPASETPEPSPAADFTVTAAGAITKYTGSDGNVVIPREINGVTIKSIGDASFDSSKAKNIVIPSTVVYVGSLPSEDTLEGIYFYGDCPTGLEDVLLYTYYADTTTIYCKQAYRSDFEGLYGLNGDWDDEEFLLDASIVSTLEDPAYPAAPSHSWAYTDNGDGTHDARCTDEDCNEVIAGEAHTFTQGVCVCGAKVDGSKAEMFNYSVADGEATIIGYNASGLGGEITLPSTYTDESGTAYPVTAVGANAFNGNGNNYANTDAEALTRITKITVPASITTVGDYAFNYVGRYQTRLWNLREIVFEAEEVSFGRGVFGGNTGLTDITFPATMTEITGSMFAGDTALTALEIPGTVTAIGEKAFSGCTALREVTFRSVTPPAMAVSTGYPSGNYPFAGLTQDVTLYVPEAQAAAYNTAWADMLSAGVTKAGSITVVGKGQADVPTVVSIPDFKVYVNGTTAASDNPQYLEYHVTSFDNASASGTVELKYVGWNSSTKALEIPETVTARVAGLDWHFTVTGIGENAMFSFEMTGASSNYWFPAVSFPATLTYIAKGGCWALEKVTELDLSGTKVHTIGTYAFYGCSAAVTVRLPATLEKMGTESSTITIGGDDAKAELTYTENVFACCDALQNIFVDAANPSFKDVDGVLYTKDGTKLIRYPNARPAAHFDIPEGVKVIASQAFMQSYRGGSVLETVSFPSTLKEIESLAFRQSNLTSVTLPAHVKFGTSVFDISKKLASVTIPEGVEALGDYMFWSCEALTEVSFPDSLKSVGSSCFGHTGLTKVDLNQVEVLGDYAFYITHLSEVSIPATANTIGTAVFADIDELTRAVFAEGAETVGRFMFSSDYALTDLTLPDSITRIGEYAFSYCVGLTEITMPKSLSEMGDAVFYKCWKSLYKVEFPDEVQITALPASTFESCQALTYLYLGKNISSTGPVSLYDTNKALQVDCSAAEDHFVRSPFDVYPYDLSDKALFKDCKENGTDENGNIIYLVQLTEAGVSGGCGGSGATEDAWYAIYAGTAPVFTYGSATPAAPVVFTLYVNRPGEETVSKTYTKSELMELVDVTAHAIGYQHWTTKNGETVEKVIAANKYVTLSALLADAGLEFGRCDAVTAAASDGFTAVMTYADSVTGKYYIENGQETEVPAALLLSWNTGSDTLEKVAASAYDSGNIRFGYGISNDPDDETLGYGYAKGKRIASNVASLTIDVKGAHEAVSETPVRENEVPATCTDAGSYDEVIRCTACDTVISSSTVTVDALGHDFKDGVCTRCAAADVPAAPAVQFGHSASSGKPMLVWNAVTGAVSYNVYRAESADGTYTKINTTTATSYVNTGAKEGVTYFYKVTAVSESGESEFSNVVSGQAKVTPQKPSAPVVKIGNSASSGKPMLTWNAVSGAVSYNIYRAEGATGTYTKINSTTATSYTNTGVKGGVTYYYKVTAVNSVGESAYSNVVSGQAKSTGPVTTTPVVTMSHSSVSGKPMLTWKTVSGAASYRVSRATSKAGKYTVLGTTSALSYTNTGAVLGTTYYYKVEALNAAGKVVGVSAIVEGKVAPVLTVGYSTVSGKPQLTWKAVPGATSYKVYRAASQNGVYSLLGNVTATSYVNTGAKANTTYFYKVVAVKGTAVSDFSNIVSARPSK